MAIRMNEQLEEERKRLLPILDLMRDAARDPRRLTLNWPTADLRRLADHIEHLTEECRRLTTEERPA